MTWSGGTSDQIIAAVGVATLLLQIAMIVFLLRHEWADAEQVASDTSGDLTDRAGASSWRRAAKDSAGFVLVHERGYNGTAQ